MSRSRSVVALVAAALAGCQPTASTPPAPASVCPPAVASDTLPSACSIMERHVERIGGRETLAGIRSVQYDATLEYSAAGISANVAAFAARPNLLLVRATVAGIGEISNGFDGEVGWSIAPMTGPRLLEGRELAMARENADFDAFAKHPSRYTTTETVGRTEFEGRPAWHVRAVLQSGREVDEYYDAETELQIGSISEQESAAMRARITTIFEDYRQFGPLLLPGREIQRLPGGQQTVLTRNSVRFNEVPDSVFALPPQIRALVGN